MKLLVEYGERDKELKALEILTNLPNLVEEALNLTDDTPTQYLIKLATIEDATIYINISDRSDRAEILVETQTSTPGDIFLKYYKEITEIATETLRKLKFLSKNIEKLEEIQTALTVVGEELL